MPSNISRNTSLAPTLTAATDDSRVGWNGAAHRSSSSPEPEAKKVKLYRVYFNSKAAAPNCWSVDEGTIATEIIVSSIELIGVDSVTRLNLAADNVDDPKAWFEVHGRLTLQGSDAVIEGS